MGKKEFVVDEVQRIMESLEQVRNVAIVAHVDHGKTTLTDSLVARAGLISKELAGSQRMMDYDEQEQARGITIKAANISLGFNYEGKDYLINLIDTPGHVDFGGHVTRAMRAVDGVVVVVDSVEGVMPQTETVLRQALKERAKPVIFINKVDRLITELKLTKEQMIERLTKLIVNVNKIIQTSAPPEYKEDWAVSVENGKVVIGSAFNKWALSITSMKKTGINLGDIYTKVEAGDHKSLVEKSPLDEVLLEIIIKHLPTPYVAQKYRIPVLWKGDLNSPTGQSMLNCDANAPVVGIVFGVVHDEHAGEVGVARLFAGKVEKGTQLYIASKMTYSKAQQVAIYMGPDRIGTEKLTAGNIGAIIGLRDLYVGETISSEPIEPFEQIKHYSEPVVTKSIEAKNSKDLGKLIEALRGISKEDPTLKVTLNQETGEHLISGMGELHLEIVEYKIREEKKIPIETSPPIVVYRETMTRPGPVSEGKSPNKHNKFYIKAEPLSKEVMQMLDNGEIKEGVPKGKNQDVVDKLVKSGWDRDEAKGIWDVYNRNIIVDATKGVQYLNEVQELAIQSFEDAMDKGPLAQEKVSGLKITIDDVSLHEDNVHRGPAQILPAVRNAIYISMIIGGIVLLEPKQKVLIQVPHEYAGDIINLVNGKRGQMVSMEQEEDLTKVVEVLPVFEMLGFSNAVRSASQGRAIWYQEYAGYDPLPAALQAKIVEETRKRKGLPPNPPTPATFTE
jgi:elongation factor 2